MLNAATGKGKILDRLDHATNAERCGDEIPEAELVERCAPCYYERIVN